MNVTFLTGNVGKDPEIRTFENGDKIASFTMATSEYWKDKQGQKQERTEWHTIQVSGAIVGVVEKFVTKGMKLAVQGSLRYSTSGEGESKKFYTKIYASKIEFLSKSNNVDSDTASEVELDGDGLPF